jgi:O-antigen ligase
MIGSILRDPTRAIAARRLVLLRVGIVAGLLLLGLVMGILIARGRLDPMLLLAGAVGTLGLFAWRRVGRFEHGILAIALAAGLLNFFTLPTGTQSRIVISLLIALALASLWLLEMLVTTKRIALEPSPINKPLLAFVVISVVAYLWSTLLRDPLVFVPDSFPLVQGAALMVNILLPLLALLVFNKIKEVVWLRWLVWIMIGLGVFKLLSIQFNLPTAVMIDNGSRGVFAAWVGAMIYSQALFNEELPLWKRLLLLALLAVWVYWYFIKYVLWFSGWVPLMVACALITLMRSKKLFVVVALIALVYVGINYNFYSQKLYEAKVTQGDLERLDLWQMNLEHVVRHPLFGMGPAGYAVYNMTYHPEDARSTHNNYFDVLAQTGIVGLGAFIWMFIAFIRVGIRSFRALAGRRDFEAAFASATLAGCIGALVSMLLGDWVLPFAYNQTITGFDNAAYTWIFLGAMVSLDYIVRHTTRTTDETGESV